MRRDGGYGLIPAARFGSYSDIAESETYSWPLSSLVPDILKYFDLPDCYRALESKNLKQIDPWGPNGPKAVK